VVSKGGPEIEKKKREGEPFLLKERGGAGLCNEYWEERQAISR